MPTMEPAIRTLTWLSLATAAVLFLVTPSAAPAAVLPALVFALRPLVKAWRLAEGTALRPAIAWGSFALALGIAAEGLAWLEPLPSGRPLAGHLSYLCTLAALAGLTSVLNARTPGGGAWSVLMSLLVLVFLIPWLEASGLGRAPDGLGRLRLDNPWTIFYGLLVLAGVTNFLPTRYGPAAAWLGAGFLIEYAGLTRWVATPEGRAAVWAAVPLTLAGAVATAEACGRVAPDAESRVEAVWFWFRDHWGVVWGLRVMERFNRSAETLGWPVRLGWQGLMVVPGASVPAVMESVPDGAEDVLKGLLRRFAAPWRLDRAAGAGGIPPCQGGGPPR